MDEALSILLERFNSVPLKCVLVENGIFCHLGTVSELLELVMSCTAPSPETITYAAHKYKALCAKYGLRASTCSVIDSDSSHTSLLSGCLINSIIDGSGLIAARTIVEHSMLLGSYNIGRGSIVSHVDATFGRDLTLGDEQVLQFVSLLGASSDADMKIPSILMYFGVGDDVKGSLASGKATLLGRKWNDVFQVSNCTETLLADMNNFLPLFYRCMASVLKIFGPTTCQRTQTPCAYGMQKYFRSLRKSLVQITRSRLILLFVMTTAMS